MNVTIYTLNNWLLYFIYLLKGFMSVITIISVQLDYVCSTERHIVNYHKPDTTLGLRK